MEEAAVSGSPEKYGSIVHLMRYGFQIGYDDDEILTVLLCRRRAKLGEGVIRGITRYSW